MGAKQQFFTQLDSIFIGQSIQDHKDNSGYTNLIRLKSRYYKDIKKHIADAIEKHTTSRSMETELYNRLYTFFESYLNDTGTPFFYKTEFFKNIYARVYSNNKDVNLFWKTQDLYYVKSDPLYRTEILTARAAAGAPEYTFCFTPHADFRQAQGNEKRTLQFHLLHTDPDQEEIHIQVSWKQNGDTFDDLLPLETTQDAERKEIDAKFKKYSGLNHRTIGAILTQYKRQAEVDYFIHKDARAFLNEQLDIYLYTFLFNEVQITEWDAASIQKVAAFRQVAKNIIEYIACFENELKHMWEKPKIAKEVHYVITIDNLSRALLEKIAAHRGMAAQIAEWQQLGIVDSTFTAADMLCTPPTPQYVHLPIDTVHFADIKYDILTHFDNIDDSCDGVMIKSDNYHALNTLLPKYRSQVQCIYIDPPFNTGKDFEYKDAFQDGSWLSLISNRIDISAHFLMDSGGFYLHLDQNAVHNARIVLNSIFNNNFINEIIWRKRAGGGNDSKFIANEHDNILFYAKNTDAVKTNGYTRKLESYKKDDGGYYLEKPLNDQSLNDSPGLHYDISMPNGKILHGNEHQWKVSIDTYKAYLANNQIIYKNNKVYYKHYIDPQKDLLPSSILYNTGLNASGTHELKKLGLYFDDQDKPTAKPENLLFNLLNIASKKNDLIMDFFTGYATTVAVGHKLGLKWIGVEMGEHFYSVVLPRMKKVLAYDRGGISTALKEKYSGGGIFKYYALEQYEETLRNATYVMNEDDDGKKIIDMRKSEKLSTAALHIEPNNTVLLRLLTLYPDCDIMETISNITGWKIKKYLSRHRALFDDNGTEKEIDTATMKLTEHPYLKPYIYWDST